MQIKLWKNFNKRKNSTKQPADASAVTKTVRLKESTSIESPSFLLLKENDTFDYNYCQALGHYFYIDDVIISTNGTVELRCSQDLLATYKSQIGATSAFIQYATNGSTLINDPRVSMKEIYTKTQTSQEYATFNPNEYTYMVSVLGANSSSAPYAMTPTDFLGLTQILFTDQCLSEGVSYKTIGGELLKIMDSPGDCLISCTAVPWTFSGGTRVNDIWLGAFNASTFNPAIKGKRLMTGTIVQLQRDVFFNPVYDESNFRFSEPYSNYTMFLPGVGVVPISSKWLRSSLGVRVEYYLDFDGKGSVILQTLSGNHFIASYPVNVGVQIPVGSYNNSGTSISAITGAVDTIKAAVSSSPAELALSSVNGIMSLASHQATGGGVASGFSSIYDGKIRCTCIACETESLDANIVGRPLMKTQTIAASGGYVQTVGASVSIGGLGQDRDAINAMLDAGIYYE